MLRWLALAACLAAGCSRAGPDEPFGTVVVHTDATAADDLPLYIDARPDSRLTEGRRIELEPGPHVFEARRGDRVLTRVELTVLRDSTAEISLDVPRPPAPAPEATASNRTPTRQEVVSAMNAVSPAVSACGNGGDFRGVVPVRMVFRGADGSVIEATAEGPAPLAVRQCAERAVREVRVPSFARLRFTVNFPFRI